MATSVRAAENDANGRGGCPMSTCEESVKAMVSPNSAISTSTAAPDCTECPDVYSGNGGVGITVWNFGSKTRCTYVTGRTTLERYFSRQQPMNASAIAMDVSAYSSAAASALSPRRATIWFTTLIQ